MDDQAEALLDQGDELGWPQRWVAGALLRHEGHHRRGELVAAARARPDGQQSW